MEVDKPAADEVKSATAFDRSSGVNCLGAVESACNVVVTTSADFEWTVNAKPVDKVRKTRAIGNVLCSFFMLLFFVTSKLHCLF